MSHDILLLATQRASTDRVYSENKHEKRATTRAREAWRISLLLIWLRGDAFQGLTANLRTSTKFMDFRGFYTSIILTLRGGIPRPIGNSLESLSHAILVGIILVGIILVGIILVGRLGVGDHDPGLRRSLKDGAAILQMKTPRTRHWGSGSPSHVESHQKSRLGILLGGVCFRTPDSSRGIPCKEILAYGFYYHFNNLRFNNSETDL